MSNYDFRQLGERYKRDNEFATVVNVMYAMILDHGMTIEELRQAAFFACMKYQMEQTDYRFIVPKGEA